MLRTGESLLLPETTDMLVDTGAGDPAPGETLAAKRSGTVMVVPLLVRGHAPCEKDRGQQDRVAPISHSWRNGREVFWGCGS